MGLPLLVAAGLVQGCTTMEPPAAPRGPCVVDGRVKMRFAGVKFRARMRPEIEQATNAAMSRVLRPGDAATMDFRADRLNILLDDGGLIDGLRCG
ncbi:I78 family peptidase inhibitor [Sphingomonas insulae]|nr:I78 family peptidase inhibitor [Sphingomonas insulae]